MGKTRPCAVCGKITNKYLFGDKTLDTPICSKKCEYEHLNNLTPSAKEQMNMLRSIDDEIKKNQQSERVCWATAGFGALILAFGFFTSNVEAFLVGLFPLTIGAFSTSYFEAAKDKLIQTRKRIII